MLSFEEFDAQSAPLRVALEGRRRKYLRYFCIGSASGLLLLGAALFLPDAVLRHLQALALRQVPLKPSDILAFRLFACLVLAGLALGPLFSYRGIRGVSIARGVASRLLGCFGTFMPAQGGGISPAELKVQGFTLPALLHYPGEGASGEMNGVRVRLTETSLITREETLSDRLVFHGLMILVDRQHHSAAAESRVSCDDAAAHEHVARAFGAYAEDGFIPHAVG